MKYNTLYMSTERVTVANVTSRLSYYYTDYSELLTESQLAHVSCSL